MKLVILITARTDQSLGIAQAWQKAGASGVTIVEGHGLRQLQENMGIRDDMPLIPSLSSLLERQEVSAMLLISLVENELVEALQQATTEVLGDLFQPNNGLILTLDVENALGLVSRKP
jgi:hypothetical protein